MRIHLYALLTLLLMVIVFSLEAATRKVPQDYAKIQLAINAAVNGDTVLVAEGIYFENLVIKKNIVVGSLFVIDKDTSHISKTIINGGSPANPDSASVISISVGTDSNTVITGFTIQNGKGTRSYDASSGKYWRGGNGIYLTAGAANIHHNIITDNSIISSDGVWGGGIAMGPNDGPLSYWIIENNQIRNNNITSTATTVVAAEGGGVWLTEDGRFNNNLVMDNSAIGVVYGSGGGISLGGSPGYGSTTIEMSSNNIRGNEASHWGGGIVMYIDPTLKAIPYVTLKNNIISGNTASELGAAMHVQGGTYTFINNTITGNTGPQAIEVQSFRGTLNMRFLNNIIWNPNSSTEFLASVGANPKNIYAQYTCIRGGFIGTGNINVDPLFVPSDSLYHLTNSSPCIGAGIFTASIGGVQLTAPTKDYSGSSRPNPSWSKPDLGAMESPQAFPGVLHSYNVPQDFAKIQDAINASVNGDVVIISEGTYKENLVINKKITLASLYFQDKDTSHISKTILDGSAPTNADSGSTITLGPNTDTTLVITGFTIQGGKGNKEYDSLSLIYWLGGGGIQSSANGGARISHNIFRGNSVTKSVTIDNTYGGGIGITGNLALSQKSLVIIEKNTISGNSVYGNLVEAGGIGLYGVSGRIEGNIIENNVAQATSTYSRGGGITIGAGCSISLIGNRIRRNTSSNLGGGIFFNGLSGYSSTLVMVNNIIWENSALGGAGMRIGQLSTTSMINNTFASNKGGIEGNGFSVANIGGITIQGINNIFANESPTNQIVIGPATYAFQNNLIFGQSFGTNSINADPQILSTHPDSLGILKNSSPCIGAGVLSALLGGVTLNSPSYDYFNTPRPRASGSNPDIGALENDLSNPVGSVKDITEIPTSFELSQNYPNPFNPTTTIRYALPSSANVKLVIYDLLGREITTLVNEEQSAGWKEVQWNASNFASGMYLVRMSTNNFVEAKKILLMK